MRKYNTEYVRKRRAAQRALRPPAPPKVKTWTPERKKEWYRAYKLEWGRKNAAKRRASCAKRHAQKLRATPPWLTKDQLREIADWYALAVATGRHVDHIVPLQGEAVCGLHVPWNLQLLTREENGLKSNKLDVVTT